MLTGRLECDIIEVNRWKIDRWIEKKMEGWEGAKTGSILRQYRRVLKMCRN